MHDLARFALTHLAVNRSGLRYPAVIGVETGIGFPLCYGIADHTEPDDIITQGWLCYSTLSAYTADHPIQEPIVITIINA